MNKRKCVIMSHDTSRKATEDISHQSRAKYLGCILTLDRKE